MISEGSKTQSRRPISSASGASKPDLEKQTFREVEEARSFAQRTFAPHVFHVENDGRAVLRIKRSNLACRAITIVPSEFIGSLSSDLLLRMLDQQELPLDQKSRLLAELVTRGNPDLPSFFLNALRYSRDNPPWRNELLFALEHVHFIKLEQRNRLIELLSDYLTQLRGAVNPNSVSALWAALRVFSSIIPVNSIDSLLPFLSSENDLGTRQLVLQSIQKMFTDRPPDRNHFGEALSKVDLRVSELARKYLDPDWLTPGDNSSIALNAFYASAALASNEIISLSKRLGELKISRLTRFTRRFLEAQLASWIGNGVDHRDIAVANIRNGLSFLSQ